MDILRAFDDAKLFGKSIPKGDWAPWKAFLGTLFGLPGDPSQRALVVECTGRSKAPTEPFAEAYLICGRRAGKSFILALASVYLATCRSYKEHLAPGERATVLILAADRRQARVIFRYIKGLIDAAPMLRKLVTGETAEALELSNRVTIEVGTASHRSARGYSYAAVLADELAFWHGDGSTKPDVEVLAAIRPGLSTIPGAMLLCASSPYAKTGALYDAYSKHFGRDESPVLIWHAPTKKMNPTFSQATIDRALEADPHAAASEYLARWRDDVANFVTQEAVEDVVSAGVRERPYSQAFRYHAHVDPSGGVSDSYVLAIAHAENGVAILDMVREIPAPFNPEAATAELVADLRRYKIGRVLGDRYAEEWPRQAFARHAVSYELSDKASSEIYSEALAAINSKRVDLLDNSRLFVQLLGLERRTGRNRDVIDHRPGGHDDVALASCGALLQAATAAPVRRSFLVGAAIVGGRSTIKPGFSHGSKYWNA